MKQIDEARERLEERKTVCSEMGDKTACTMHGARIREAEAEVERLLREWWDQGCTEGEVDEAKDKFSVAAYLAAQRDDARLLAETAEKAMSSVVDRIQAFLRKRGFAPPLDGQDHVDRVLAVLNNVIEGRNTAEVMVCRLEKERDDWKAKYGALERHRADQENLIEALHEERGKLKIASDAKVAECDRLAKVAEVARRDYAVAAKQIEWDRIEIAKLTLSANEMDATNKKIHADRDRLAAAMRGALEALRLRMPRAGIDETLRQALKDYESITEVSSYKERYFPEGAAFRSTCACGRHVLPPAGYVDDAIGHHNGKRCNLTIRASRHGAVAFDLEGQPQNLPRAKSDPYATHAEVDEKIAKAIYAHEMKHHPLD